MALSISTSFTLLIIFCSLLLRLLILLRLLLLRTNPLPALPALPPATTTTPTTIFSSDSDSTSASASASAAESSPISRTCYAFSILPDGGGTDRAGSFTCLESQRCSFVCPGAHPRPASCAFSLTIGALLAFDADAAASSLCIVASADAEDERDYQIDVACCSVLEDCRFCCHPGRPVPIGLDADRPAQLCGRRFGPKEQDF